MNLTELATAELRVDDIGRRIVVIDPSGNAYAGVLVDLSAIEWKYGDRTEDKVRIRIKVRSDERSTLALETLPLDFRVQIERNDPS